MRPTFLGFEASKTALFSTQKALDITGHNLANISTEGYTRQRVVQTSNYIDDTNSRYAPIKGANDGEGVNIEGVNQIRNDRLDVSYRTQNKDVGYHEQKSDMLSNIETIMQEFDEGKTGYGYGLSNSIYEVYTALEDFSNNPTSEADANVVSTAFRGMSQTFNQIYKKLDEYTIQAKDELKIDISEVNEKFQKIANLNKTIKASVIANGYTDEYGPNELLDQRNLLLDEISEFGNIEVKDNIDGTVDVTFNGHQVIKDSNYDTLEVREENNGSVSVYWTSSGNDATSGNGKIKAYTDILNGAGINAQNGQSTENGIPYYKNKLDDLAATIADVFNNIIPNGTDANGNTTYVKIFGEKSDDGNVYPEMRCSAEGISITKELEKDSTILIRDKDSSDNKSILKMITSLTEEEFAFDDTTFRGTFSDYINDYVGTLGSDVSYNKGRAAAVSNITTEIANNRDAVSGVSESEETVNMMTYNRAFQAASRMMTVMDDLLNVLINQMAV